MKRPPKLGQDLKGLACELIYPNVHLATMQPCEDCQGMHRLTIWSKCRQCYIEALLHDEEARNATTLTIMDAECMDGGRKQHTAIDWKTKCKDIAPVFIQFQSEQLRRIDEDVRSIYN
jgi:hypothetical protein